MDARIVGSQIRLLRQSSELNQKAFSEKVGIKQSTLSSYENGNLLPSVDVLVSIAKSFDVSLDWLCGISKNSMSISSAGDVGRLLFALEDIANLRYELEVHDKLPNDIETPDNRWYVALKFFGNEKEYPVNASVCQMLASFAEYRREFESYFINKEFFDTLKDKCTAYHDGTPLIRKQYEEIPEDQRIALRNAKILAEAEKAKSGE